MKIKWLVSMIAIVLLIAIGHADDKDKDKKKTTPPPKQAVAVQHKPTSTSQQKPALTPQQKTVAHPTVLNAKASDHGRPNIGAQGTPQHVQSQSGMRRQVSTLELHQRLNAPVSREEHIRAHNQYRQAEVVRYRMRAVPIRLEPRHRVVLTGMRIVPGTYYHRRAVFYETYGYVPPAYIYGFRPAYGLWDARFLGFMLWRLAFDQEYALMYYNHMGEPEFIQWRQEMDGLAAENADLREKLAVMDQRVAQLEGTPRNAAYVPQEAGDVALSPDVIDKFTSEPEKH